ncbi:hypothetical protein ABZ491_27090 [Micromonospora rifamycinica]|uniref:hypothetical protein n=1 Tax=Micromonospora rifamycinica TaxID=291594 RepID=UPI00343BE729
MRSLEDLRNAVVSNQSRAYVDEAIGAYNSGSYRSSILALWIAVVADIIDKIRAMAEQGERAAVVQRDALETAIKNREIQTLQRLESKLLEVAESLQLFGKRERDELARLKEDRNLCAHPAYVTEEDLFNPSAELVRLHLQVAVDNLLAHGPIVGKRAIDRFKVEVQGNSFLSDDAKLKVYLWESYLRRGSVSFLRNFVKFLSKAALSEDVELHLRRRHVRALIAVHELRPGEVEVQLKDFLRNRQLGFSEDELLRFVGGLLRVPCVPALLEESVGHRIEEMLRERPIVDLLIGEELFTEIPPEPFGSYLADRLPDAASYGNSAIFGMIGVPDVRLFGRLLEEFKAAGSYPYCAQVASWFTAMSPSLDAEKVGRILEVARLNDQAYGSVLTRRELERLKWATAAHSGAPELFNAFDEWDVKRRGSTPSESGLSE